jgi:sec-independent protein translocase protein TatA
MFENLGYGEILLIAVVMLVFFGPKKLPEMGKSLGKGLSEFRRAMHDVQESITSDITNEKK